MSTQSDTSQSECLCSSMQFDSICNQNLQIENAKRDEQQAVHNSRLYMAIVVRMHTVVSMLVLNFELADPTSEASMLVCGRA